MLLTYLPTTNNLCFLGACRCRTRDAVWAGARDTNSVNLLLKAACGTELGEGLLHLQLPSSSLAFHDLCKQGTCKAPLVTKYTSNNCLQTFYHNVNFLPFFSVFFFLFKCTGEEYLHTQGIQVMPMGYGRIMWLLFQTCIPN